MLRVSDIETFYGRSQVLFGVSFEVGPGEVVTLMGRNGMGKTTTVRSIMGLTPPRSGRIRFEGAEIQNRPSHEVARAGLALVPEGRQVFPTLTVRENLIATAANRSGAENPWTVQRVFEMFPMLEERRNFMGRTLSGGEQQMLAIGRALMINSKVLILDDATEGLAPLIRAEIWRCLERLKEAGQSILVIDRSLDALTRIADRHYIMEKGKVVWSGDSAALAAQPELRVRYLGV
ncbi:MAG: ABC transporter ATP-binding protein [Nitrospinota bacterium]|jgi:branched-chain amino acid transport system ATP-binding protein|nr:ABC transporter ATP-binding protein [Nitrospinota bacterium]MDP6618058.1 ABC transporter ATP-binding protein [Nitrospinota bacterium]